MARMLDRPRVLAASAAVVAALTLAPAEARADDDGPAGSALEGFRYRLEPGMLFTLGALGTTNFALNDHLGYGINIGGVVLSPGLSVPLYLLPNNFTVGIMGELQAYYPMGMLAPYVRGGGGIGIFTGLGTTDGVFRGGGGLMFIPLKQIGIGADVSYAKLGNTDGLQVVFPIHLALL
jgi:hypothetical protein